MKVTTITCDRCKQVIIDLQQVWPVKVEFGNYNSPVLKAEWCRSCVIEMGCLKAKEETKQPIVEPPPTIEDFIREIVREEIDNI